MTRALPPGLTTRPVIDLAPGKLALCWRRGDSSREVHALVDVAREVGDALAAEHR